MWRGTSINLHALDGEDLPSNPLFRLHSSPFPVPYVVRRLPLFKHILSHVWHLFLTAFSRSLSVNQMWHEILKWSMKKEEEDHLVSSLNGIMLRKIGHNKCPEMYIQMRLRSSSYLKDSSWNIIDVNGVNATWALQL
jgi:hypothetical protein